MNRAEKIKKGRKPHVKATPTSAEGEVNEVRTRRDLWALVSSICLSRGLFLWPRTNCGSLAASPPLCNENGFIHQKVMSRDCCEGMWLNVCIMLWRWRVLSIVIWDGNKIKQNMFGAAVRAKSIFSLSSKQEFKIKVKILANWNFTAWWES